MRRIALGFLLAASLNPPAVAADRTDRIPAAVGPSDFRSYHVNATANLPEGVDGDRWLSVARRTLERWGGTYLGTTTASPDVLDDGLNVIGFSHALAGTPAVGRNAKAKGGRSRSAGDACRPEPASRPSESVATRSIPFKLKLRADVVRRGRVRRRTRTVTKRLSRRVVERRMLDARRCVRTDAGGFETDPATVYHESDIQMHAQETWFLGEGLPSSSDLDLETVLLHELGHSVGLDHQPQDCDPSSPMRPVTGRGDYWRGPDQVFYEGCEAYPVTPDPPTGTPTPFIGGSLAGRSVHVNPAVPGGYESERFVALARSAVERWGGTYAGPTSAPPASGDGLNVIGFDLVAATEYEVNSSVIEEFMLWPATTTCATRQARPQVYRVRRATRRVRVRGRRYRLRRDRAVRALGRPVAVPTGSCSTRPPATETASRSSELDIGIAHEMLAYELGPAHPVLATKVDMETLLGQAVGIGAGATADYADPCGSSPVSAGLQPGTWWRSADDRSSSACRPAGRTAARSARGDERRTVIVQD